MSDPIDVVLVTWPNHPARMQYLQRTWDSFSKLSASRHQIRFLCSSESERDPKCEWCGDALEAWCKEREIPLSWHEGPASLGAGMNHALQTATSELIVLAQDDYELMEPLDLSPSAELLTNCPQVDLVRFAYPATLGCKFIKEKDGFKQFDLRAPWPYGDEPHMRRRGFMDKYGWYRENIGHAAEANMLWRLAAMGALIVATEKIYFGNFGAISAVPAHKERRKREVKR